MAIVGTALIAVAALVHVLIFVMESVTWARPATWRRFGVRDQASAESIRPMAYNQGFYNLFLAVGAGLGLALYWQAEFRQAGTALAVFAAACMVAASVVLLSTGRSYWRAALFQGAVPLAGLILLLV